MFVPCDRHNHVSGHVYDAHHKPIDGVTVEFYGVEEETDKNGCFYFGGLLAAEGFNIKASKPGFKTYLEGKRFEYYDIEIILAETGTGVESSGNWKQLNKSELTKYEQCQDN